MTRHPRSARFGSTTASAIVAGMIFAASAAMAARQAVTLETLLAVPFPSEIASAPDGMHVAWVLNDKGARNVWVASAPVFTPRRLTAFSGDDGQDITSLTWAPDGRALLFVRGGGPNRAGEIPNPAISPQPAEQAIWAGEISGKAPPPRRLAPGSSPAVSRTGHIAYLARGQVWVTSVDGTEKPSQLFTMRGSARDLRWSPDGGRLALVSARGDHSFIGVYDVAEKTLRYLDPSIDQDGNPSWSPDGTRIAFTRIPSTGENFMFAPRREALPWSIRIVDVASGTATEVWKAQPGPGSVFQAVNTAQQLMWAAGDRLVFPWERDGWIHLYAIPAAGGPPTLLTPGAFEVEHVAPGIDRQYVFYSSNQPVQRNAFDDTTGDRDDSDRRHIWRVPVDASTRPVSMTEGTGSEWMPAPLASNNELAFIAASGWLPGQVKIRLRGPRNVQTPFGLGATMETAVRSLLASAQAADDMAAFTRELVEPQRVTITATDGMPIPAQLFLPRDLKAGEKRPAILFFHGGSRRQMLLTWHYLSYYHNTYAMNQYLANRGYIVLSVNYRSGTGYGLNFREALNYGATGASEFNDVIGAGLYMKGRSDVDPARIGIYGGSYGGYLTAHALARASDLFAAGVDIHGVHDWNVGIRTFMPNYAPGPDIAARNFGASPLNFVAGWRSPVLLIHGDDDRNVSFAETVTLAEALRKQGVRFESLVIPDEVHGFLRYESWLRVFRASADFFDRHLKAGKSATSQ